MRKIIDIHSHILPGVDDGARDMEMAIEMVKIYKKNNIDRVIATPHYVKNSSMSKGVDYNIEVLEELREEIEREELDFEILLGNEVYICRDLLEKLEEKKIRSLNSSRYIFIELPQMDIPDYTKELLEEIIRRGYVPILAHPERNSLVVENVNIVYEFISLGALVQLDMPSIDGKYGMDIKSTGELLLRQNMVHFLGTASHSSIRRTAHVDGAVEKILELIGDEKFKTLSYENPKRVIEDQVISIEKAIEYRKKIFFNIFFKK